MTLIYGIKATPRQQFAAHSNQDLIDQANRSPAFGLDGEITTELERRRIDSNGRFDYRFVHSKLIITKDEPNP